MITRECSEVIARTCESPEICGKHCNAWRACPIVGCDVVAVRCSVHGGDDAAKTAMVLHIDCHIAEGR